MCDKYTVKSNSTVNHWACNSREIKPIMGRHAAGVRGGESLKEDPDSNSMQMQRSLILKRHPVCQNQPFTQNGGQKRNLQAPLMQGERNFLEGLGNLLMLLVRCGVVLPFFGLKEIPGTDSAPGSSFLLVKCQGRHC